MLEEEGTGQKKPTPNLKSVASINFFAKKKKVPGVGLGGGIKEKRKRKKKIQK